MKKFILFSTSMGLMLALAVPAYPEVEGMIAKNMAAGQPNAAVKAVDGVIDTGALKKEIKPYRTFITIQRYNMEQSGDAEQISNVRIEVMFPNQKNPLQLPEGGGFWPIGNGQVQEINRTFELPYQMVQNDGFKFTIQMFRKGSTFLPCQFDVSQLSEFNRGYVCHTDLGYQNGLLPEKQDKEGIQVRVFTDRNSEAKEIPKEALALK